MTKTTTACINEDALTFETTLLDIQNRSTRRAWWVAGGACGLSLLLGCTIVLMQPLKTVVPYLVTVDKQTGYTEIQTVLTDVTQLSQQEALDGYWVANYVRWHETYQWQSIQEAYDNVLLFSSDNVGRDYAQLFKNDKQSLEYRWGKNTEATVKITGMSFNAIKPIATVRFEKTIRNVSTPIKPTPTRWIATVAYEYDVTREVSLSIRYKNPLGFTVTSWRIDPETL